MVRVQEKAWEVICFSGVTDKSVWDFTLSLAIKGESRLKSGLLNVYKCSDQFIAI